jgi:transposase
MDELTDTTVSRQEAARILGVSLRTLDRWIPEGTAGRFKRPHPGRAGRPPAPNDEVRIERSLLTALTTAPGGNDDAE